MIFKMTVTENQDPTDFLEDQAELLKVDAWENIVFVRIPKDSTAEFIVDLDKKLKLHLGKKPYIIISESVQFCKLEEVK